ncbi:MAG TPA: helix-turn-helix domain-containing protein [Solirubrobacteraceae bacterium]
MRSDGSRADARRSRRLLLDAGASAFTEHGLDVQVSEITRRAGLAKGTFFRHFPTKRALLVEILAESVHELSRIARAIAAGPPADAVTRYMDAAAAQMAPLRAVIENAILHGIDTPSLHDAMGDLMESLAPLLDGAKRRGELRTDVTPLDIHILLMGATSTSARFFHRDQPDLWKRYLALTLDGLRPQAAHPLPVAPPPPPTTPTASPPSKHEPRMA